MAKEGDRFVRDGAWRLSRALREEARKEVEAKCADELARAGWWQRWRLRRKISSEIAQRIRQQMPSKDALYWAKGAR